MLIYASISIPLIFRDFWVNYHSIYIPANPFTILEPRDQEIGLTYVVQ